jgi:hypothetical protein
MFHVVFICNKITYIMKTLIAKTIILCSAIGLITCSAMAQSTQPMPVTNAFNARYPTAKVKDWKMKGDTCIAMFNMNDRHYKAFYAADGTWLRTERNVKHLTTFPLQAQMYIKNSKFASWHIDNLAKVDRPMRNSMYMVSLDNHSGNTSYEGNGDNVTQDLYFTGSGRLVKADQR